MKNYTIKIISILSSLILLASCGSPVGSSTKNELKEPSEVFEVVKGATQSLEETVVPVLMQPVFKNVAVQKTEVSIEEVKKEIKDEDLGVKESSVAVLPSHVVQKTYLKLKKGLRFSFVKDRSLFNKPWRLSATQVSIRFSNYR